MKKRCTRESKTLISFCLAAALSALVPACLVASLVFSAGCGVGPNTTAEIGSDGAKTTNQGADQANISYKGYDSDRDGVADTFKPSLTGSHQGAGSEAVMIDAQGIWQVASGPGLTVGFNPNTMQAFARSPKDTSVDSFTYTPVPEDGQPMVSATGIHFNVSDPIQAITESVVARSETLLGMTRIEAQKQIEQWKIAGDITSDVANLLLETVVPLLPPG